MARLATAVVVRAFAALARGEVRLVVAGNDMGSAAAVRRLVQALGLGTQTLFTGLLRGEDRIHALADADVVVYPSADEVFGLVPLEALLSGTPVIVADDSGCGQIVDEIAGSSGGGQIVPLGDVRALAAAIARALDQGPVARAAAAMAAARVRSAYGGEIVCGMLDGVYREIMAGA